MCNPQLHNARHSVMGERPGSDTDGLVRVGLTASLRSNRVVWRKAPLGARLVERIGLRPSLSYKAIVWSLTFVTFACFHIARKSFSVVKSVLNSANCSGFDNSCICTGWAPFDGSNGKTLLGSVDYAFLFIYAVSVYFSGFIADRVNVRYFLITGMIGSGLGLSLLGVAYFANVHVLYYFILVQLGSGIMQSIGWPSVMAVMSNWFGKHRRGLILGIWIMNTSIGNILGTVIPSIWATCDGPWGWSFVVPGFIIIVMSVPVFLLLVPAPQDVRLQPPVHNFAPPGDLREEDRRSFVAEDKGEDVQHKSVGREEPKAVGLLQALRIPGVIEYSLALFFTKLVAYTFLFWLPLYINQANGGFLGGVRLTNQLSDWLSICFDVGGIIGAVVVGGISDLLGARAVTITSLLYLAVPVLFIYRYYGATSIAVTVVLLIISGICVNGPFGVILTAVSSDLATHESLKRSDNAKATVAAIIDGTGSLGAAFGPLIAGAVSEYSWDYTFYTLMSCCFVAALLLTRLVVTEVLQWQRKHNIHCCASPCCHGTYSLVD